MWQAVHGRAPGVGGEDPWAELQITAAEAVYPRGQPGGDRVSCPECRRQCRWYCPRCLWVPPPPTCLGLPQVALPKPLLVLKHPREHPSKSTALHAALLARADTDLVIYQSEAVLETDLADTVVLFPSAVGHSRHPATPTTPGPRRWATAGGNSHACPSMGRLRVGCMTVYEICGTLGAVPQDAMEVAAVPWDQVSRVCVLDGTWRQARQMARHPAVAARPTVVLRMHPTRFWRHQAESETSLATIEAIYYLYRELWPVLHPDGPAYSGAYDDLLFLFREQYERVAQAYAAPERQAALSGSYAPLPTQDQAPLEPDGK